MIIRLVAKSRSIEIDDPKNFRAFSVRIEGALEPSAQAELLGRIAVKQDGEHRSAGPESRSLVARGEIPHMWK
jgi:hypothetical protein